MSTFFSIIIYSFHNSEVDGGPSLVENAIDNGLHRTLNLFNAPIRGYVKIDPNAVLASNSSTFSNILRPYECRSGQDLSPHQACKDTTPFCFTDIMFNQLSHTTGFYGFIWLKALGSTYLTFTGIFLRGFLHLAVIQNLLLQFMT